ncbi:MAG: DUF364 domain-containing protein, partial [Desulfomonilia bacterium]|nr:DUF364 domain-containing protein [Desulfomonilia bacterium]
MLETCIDVCTREERSLSVLRAVLGLGFIAVELENGAVGLSANIALTTVTGCSVFKKAGTLAGSPVASLLDLAKADDLISRSLALAAVNAIAAGRPCGRKGDVFDSIKISSGYRVEMVGMIEPVARMLTGKGCEVSAFDLRNRTESCIHPADRILDVLRHADIIILSGTTLITKTLSGLLTLSGSAREVILMGPSTPMIPEIFSSTPISFLAGARITDSRTACA